MADLKRTAGKPEKRSGGWQPMAVQCVGCAVLLLITLLLRMVGGDLFAEVRTTLANALTDNTVAETIAQLLEPADNREAQPKALATTATTTATGSAASTTVTTGTTATTAPGTTTATQKAITQTVAARLAPAGVSFAALTCNRGLGKPLSGGTVTDAFGYRTHPKTGAAEFHKGLDIAAAKGAALTAMFYGTVTETGENSSYGRYVRLSFGDGISCLYAHCDRIAVRKGDIVSPADVVATVGETGDATGSHVHIELSKEGVCFDPRGMIDVSAYA